MIALLGTVTGEPTITGDLKQVFWTYQGTPNWEIWWADRAQPSADFMNHGAAPMLDATNGVDPDASITDDGLTIIYRVGANEGAAHLREATRTQTNMSFDAPHDLAGVATLGVTALDVSGDGLTLYYNVGMDLRYATRANRGASFTPKGSIGNNFPFPSISGDQLTLYYQEATTRSTTRSSTTSAFTAGQDVFTDPDLHEPEVTQDDTTMVIATRAGGTIAISTRVPCL
jgi:hypothetical protein